MKEKKALYREYPDLLDPKLDPELLQLLQELDTLGNMPTAPAKVNWSQVRIMHARQTPQKTALILPFRGPARLRSPLMGKAVLIPAVLVLVLLTTAFSFAFSPVLRDMLLQFQPSGSSLSFVSINQSATIAGRTVKVEAGYADANQVILGYTVSPNVEDGRVSLEPSLSTHAGIDLPEIMGEEGDPKIKIDGEVSVFETSVLMGNPAILDLHLSLVLIESRFIKTPGQVLLVPQNKGTATFDFTLPFHPGKIITSGQQVTPHGKAGTLQKVVITSSAIRILLHIDGFPPIFTTGSAELQAPGQTAVDYRFFGPATPEGEPAPKGNPFTGNLIAFYDYNFADKAGTWTLTVKLGTDTWIFHFEVPA